MNWEAETVSPRKINIKLNSIAPHFLVPDVIASAEFYRDKLGFDFNRYWGDPPNFVILFRDNVQLVPSQNDTNNPLPFERGPFDTYIWLDSGIGKLYGTYQENGVEIVEPLEETCYGMQQFLIKDLNGYIICFGEDSPSPLDS